MRSRTARPLFAFFSAARETPSRFAMAESVSPDLTVTRLRPPPVLAPPLTVDRELVEADDEVAELDATCFLLYSPEVNPLPVTLDLLGELDDLVDVGV